ncbi:MAG TPA: hypothetical protein VFS88_06445 [Micavibrio sp.]|nr:hypothetical protein [Micavibrio sp.]
MHKAQKQDRSTEAKRFIFGDNPPSSKLAEIGYNMAVNYFGGIIDEAEKALENPMRAPSHIPLMLRNAFQFPSYRAIQVLPDETLNSLKVCAKKFQSRYQPLAEVLETKAS